MTLTLILMRHAKSDWTDPFQDDQDRVLNPRGRASAHALGQWLAKGNHIPEQVLCSAAQRTRETWEIVNSVLNCPAQVQLEDRLYLARAQDMLTQLRNLAHGNVVLMIGHNPGIGQMAELLLQEPAPDATYRRYPTGYTAIISFTASNWQDVDWRQGQLVAHVGPRALLR